MTLSVPFEASYAALPDRFYTKMSPTEVRAPSLIALNEALAISLGLDPTALRGGEGLAMLAGNFVPCNATPLAQVYAGHQFGGWSPQLGDGRAILLGEVVSPEGRRFDIQLKGSGPTPYSRMGDGRAWVGPVLREYIISEAMHALGVPTTRALAAVATGERVMREAPLPGAVLTRVAASHIRVGTFQFFASRSDTEGLKALLDHVRARHYPEAETAVDFLREVIERQAKLVAQWMSIGFVHGVMNTDNMTISGETIDYGPCAFMDTYHPLAVYSSIDQHGRYAFGRQPDVAMWNLAQLATSLLPLLDDVEAAQAEIDRFPDLFRGAWVAHYRSKLGLQTAEEGDDELIHALLNILAEGRADFTNAFRALSGGSAREEFLDRKAFEDWEARWIARLAKENAKVDDRKDAMERVNPALVARTHRIEEAIQAALQDDFGPFKRLHQALSRPFDDPGGYSDLARPPTEDEIVPHTFCGT